MGTTSEGACRTAIVSRLAPYIGGQAHHCAWTPRVNMAIVRFRFHAGDAQPIITAPQSLYTPQ